MDTKGQVGLYPEQRINKTRISPIMILGIIVFVIPFFGPVVHFSFPGWIAKGGFILMILGMLHSIYLSFT
jgi:hypothetical protein